ncbi:glycosyltransferase [Candidatus Pelagibacter sp.]|nr:glycosyltransferase [Candidatus Pelagibacter sp.]
MSLSLKNLTFIIVTFKSEHIINECIDSLPADSEIIVIENSGDEKLKIDLEKRNPKIKVVIQNNKGMGSANNLGIKLCKTDYAFIINPDVKFEIGSIKKIIEFSNKKNDYSILAPICDNTKYPNYTIKNKETNDYQDEYINVDSVDGFAMLINKKKFKDDLYFDENFFLYLENEDLCIRKKKEKENIYVLKTAKINHLGGKSTSIIFEKEIEYCRNWHWMWSKFYFNKKHFGYFTALLRTFTTLISSMFKIIYYYLLDNGYKQRVYKMRFSGLANAMIGKKSWYRPNV